MDFITSKINSLFSLFDGNIFLFLGDILILALICISGIYFVKYLKGLQIKRNLERMKQRFFQDSEARELTSKKELKEIGYKEKHTILEKLDMLFKQAGYITYENEESTETILLKLGAEIFALAIIISILLNNIVAMPITIIVCTVAFFIVTQIIMDKNYVSIEDEILRFINMADGYASESDDIIYIIGKVYPNLKEPLFTYLKDFYYEAIHVGTDIAFQHLEDRISHKKFREIIHNIYTCSKTNANYKKIFTTSRKIMRDYIDSKKERKNIKKEKSVDFGIVLVIIVWAFFMVDGIIDNFYDFVLHTFAGNLLLIIFLCIISFGVITAFKVDKK